VIEKVEGIAAGTRAIMRGLIRLERRGSDHFCRHKPV
jgi:hypothetical protein